MYISGFMSRRFTWENHYALSVLNERSKGKFFIVGFRQLKNISLRDMPVQKSFIISPMVNYFYSCNKQHTQN